MMKLASLSSSITPRFNIILAECRPGFSKIHTSNGPYFYLFLCKHFQISMEDTICLIFHDDSMDEFRVCILGNKYKSVWRLFHLPRKKAFLHTSTAEITSTPCHKSQIRQKPPATQAFLCLHLQVSDP